MGEDQAIADDGNRQPAENCAQHRPAPSGEGGAAQNDGGDDIQLEADGGVGRARRQPRSNDDPRRRRRNSGEDIDRGRHPSGCDARPPRRLGIDADSRDVAAKLRHVEPDKPDNRDERRNKRRKRQAEQRAPADQREHAIAGNGD